ncbi:CHAT domain-containing protein, partial [Desulfobacter latus]
ALEIRTRKRAPMDWAMTQYALGNLYGKRIHGEPRDNQEKALACYTAALEIRTRKRAPMDWAMTQYALGNLYGKRIHGEPRDNQEKALAFYTAALEIRTRERAPMDWAMTQYALGALYNKLSFGDPEDNREQMLICFNNTLNLLHERMQTLDPEGSKAMWREYKRYFHSVIRTLLIHRLYKDALYWIEALKTARMLVDIDLSSIPAPEGEAGEKAADYWEVCRQIRTVRAEIEYHQKAGSPDMSPDQGDLKSARQMDPSYIASRQKELERLVMNLKELDRRKKCLLKELKKLSPDYAARIQPEIKRFEDLTALITGPQKAAVSFFVNGVSIHALTVYMENSGELNIDYRQYEINQKFKDSFREYYTALDRLDDKKSDLFEINERLINLLSLTRTLFDSLFNLFKKKEIKQIYLSPHDILEAIPLHAPAVWKEDNPTIKLLNFSYLPSLSLGVQRSRVTHPDKRGHNHAIFFSPDDQKLSAGEKEFEKLKKIYAQENISLLPREEKNATLENWAEDLKTIEPENIFISCHGRTDDNGFYLRLHDGLLHHKELISSLEIKDCHVVASACQTGTSLAWRQKKDDYYALDHVFMLMGARSCISSFYSIPDKQTSEITLKMHKNIHDSDKFAPFTAFNTGLHDYLKQKYMVPVQIHKSKGPIGSGRSRSEQKETVKLPSDSPIYWAFLKFSGLFD